MKNMKFIVAALLFVCVAIFAGCGNSNYSNIDSVGCPDIKFAIKGTDDIIFTGYNIFSVNTEYEGGTETWKVKMFDGETWHTEIAGIPPNRWYVKLTLDSVSSEKICSYLSQEPLVRIRGSRDNFAFTIDFIKHNEKNTWITSRGSSSEKAINFANFLLGIISADEYFLLL